MYLYLLHKSRSKMLTSIQVQPASQSPHPASASAATFIPVTFGLPQAHYDLIDWQTGLNPASSCIICFNRRESIS